MNYVKTTIGIFALLAFSRFIPHPPNFTIMLALSFYVPVIFGLKFLPALVLSFVITDIFIGFHETVIFTWGSMILIGLISRHFNSNIVYRVSGSLIGTFIFFIISNFGVWTFGTYGYDLKGLLICYTLAIPFFGYSFISTLFYSSLIEGIFSIKKVRSFLVTLK